MTRWQDMFEALIPIDPAGPEAAVAAAPRAWAVYLFCDADDSPVQLLSVKNLRASLRRRLGDPAPPSPAGGARMDRPRHGGTTLPDAPPPAAAAATFIENDTADFAKPDVDAPDENAPDLTAPAANAPATNAPASDAASQSRSPARATVTGAALDLPPPGMRTPRQAAAAAAAEAGLSKRIDYRHIVRRVYYTRVDSPLEADWVYLRAAKAIFPKRYGSLVGQRPAWFVRVNPASDYPRWTVTTDPTIKAGTTLGPIAEKRHATRLVEQLEDLFDLCRYHHLLIQAPGASACAYKSMGKCPAPCDGSIPMAQYRRLIEWSLSTLIDPQPEVAAQQQRMRVAAAELNYETAGRIKQFADGLAGLRSGPYAQLKPLSDFRFIALCPGPGRGTVRCFALTPQFVGPVLSVVRNDAADPDHPATAEPQDASAICVALDAALTALQQPAAGAQRRPAGLGKASPRQSSEPRRRSQRAPGVGQTGADGPSAGASVALPDDGLSPAERLSLVIPYLFPPRPAAPAKAGSPAQRAAPRGAKKLSAAGRAAPRRPDDAATGTPGAAGDDPDTAADATPSGRDRAAGKRADGDRAGSRREKGKSPGGDDPIVYGPEVALLHVSECDGRSVGRVLAAMATRGAEPTVQGSINPTDPAANNHNGVGGTENGRDGETAVNAGRHFVRPGVGDLAAEAEDDADDEDDDDEGVHRQVQAR